MKLLRDDELEVRTKNIQKIFPNCELAKNLKEICWSLLKVKKITKRIKKNLTNVHYTMKMIFYDYQKL